MRPAWLRVALAALLSGLIALAGAEAGAGANESEIESPAAVPGSAERDFEAALRAWLADNDATALPAFAALAEEGNAAARIMLSLIDRMPHTHGEWTQALPREERRALMRPPDGGSWMEAAADVPLAAHWLALWRADTQPEVAFGFADLGEARAARLTLLAHAARERGGFAELAQDPRYPAELRYLAWAERPEVEETQTERAALPEGDPQTAGLDAEAADEVDEADEAALMVWLRDAPVAAPVALFCAEACGTDGPDHCALAAYRALGGYRGLFALGPPSEQIIPPEIWYASPKGAQSVPRRIALLRPDRIEDSCLARFVGQ